MTDKYLNYINYLIANYNGITNDSKVFNTDMIPMFELGEYLSLTMRRFLKCYSEKQYNTIDVIKNINRYDSTKQIFKIDKTICKTLKNYEIL